MSRIKFHSQFELKSCEPWAEIASNVLSLHGPPACSRLEMDPASSSGSCLQSTNSALTSLGAWLQLRSLHWGFGVTAEWILSMGLVKPFFGTQPCREACGEVAWATLCNGGQPHIRGFGGADPRRWFPSWHTSLKGSIMLLVNHLENTYFFRD